MADIKGQIGRAVTPSLPPSAAQRCPGTKSFISTESVT
jgi:hypothetical protein